MLRWMGLLEAMLEQSRLVAPDRLADAKDEAKRSGRRLVEILVTQGMVDEALLYDVIARQTRIPRLDLRMARVEPDAAGSVEADWGRTHGVAPLWRDPGRGILHVAMSDPTDQLRQEELQRRTNLRIEVYVGSHSEVNAILDHQHLRKPLMRDVAQLNQSDSAVEGIDAASLGLDQPEPNELAVVRALFQNQAMSARQLQVIFEFCVEKGLIDREEYFRRLAAAPD